MTPSEWYAMWLMEAPFDVDYTTEPFGGASNVDAFFMRALVDMEGDAHSFNMLCDWVSRKERYNDGVETIEYTPTSWDGYRGRIEQKIKHLRALHVEGLLTAVNQQGEDHERQERDR